MEEMFIILTEKYSKEDDKWVGICEEHLKEAVLLHLNTLEELGERERFFKENDIKVYKSSEKAITTSKMSFTPNTARVEQYKQNLHFSRQHTFV